MSPQSGAEPAAQKGARAKGWRCRGACGTAERTACGANHHGGQVTGIGHTLSRRRRRRRRRPGNSSTCWWCGCHPVSAARGQSIDRTRAAARHDHGSLRAHGTRPLAACVGIGACLQSTWLVSHARGCGHLPSGSGSRFVRKTRDEQRSGELAAAHPHMPFGLLHTVTSPAHAAAGQSAGWPVIFGMQVG